MPVELSPNQGQDAKGEEKAVAVVANWWNQHKEVGSIVEKTAEEDGPENNLLGQGFLDADFLVRLCSFPKTPFVFTADPTSMNGGGGGGGIVWDGQRIVESVPKCASIRSLDPRPHRCSRNQAQCRGPEEFRGGLSLL